MTFGAEASSSVDLRGYVIALWRRKVLILLCLVVVIVSAMVLSYRKVPLYRSSAQLLFQVRLREVVVNPQSQTYTDPVRAQKTEGQIINSPSVREEVTKKIGANGGVNVRPLPDTDIAFVEAVDREPARAADVANAYVDAYLSFRHQQAVEDLTAAGEAVQSKITDLGKQIDVLVAQGATPAGQAAATTVPRSATADSAGRGPGSAQLDALLNQQILLKQKLDQIQVDSTLNSGGAQLVARATTAPAPFSPDHTRDLALAIAIGLVFSVGVALLWEFVDDSIDTKDDLSRLTPDIPVLASVPIVKSWRNRNKPVVVSLTEESSPAAEAYKSLRTSIHFAKLEKQITLIQVTSANEGEGKTATLANLGVALAGAGNRVIVVDCDLRRPRAHEFFQCKNDVGFVSVLLGEVGLSAAIKPVPGVPRLTLLPAGPLPPNPSELLSSRRAGEVFAALRSAADVVLVDCPPLLPVTDAVVLSEKMEATLLVVNAGTTTRRQLHHALDVLRQVDAPLIGTLLNGVPSEGAYAYKYGNYRVPPGTTRRRTNGGPKNGHVPVDLGLGAGGTETRSAPTRQPLATPSGKDLKEGGPRQTKRG